MDYRSDYEALRARADALERELAEARSALERRGETPDARLTRELAEARDALAVAKRELTTAQRELRQLRSRIASGHDERVQARAARARDPKAMLAEVRSLLKRRFFDLAEALCRELLELPLAGACFTHGDVYLEHGRILLAQKQPKKARQALARGLMEEPEHRGLRTAMAELSR